MRLARSAIEARADGLAELLRTDGELTLRATPGGASPAVLDFRIAAPSGEAGQDMSFRYAEVYEMSGARGLLVEYVYLMTWQTGLGERAYHWHAFQWSGGAAIHHAHCTGIGAVEGGHFRSHRVLLEEARAEFLRRYASGMVVDCQDLFPLSTPRI
jgi:hypothetical protein